MAELAINSQSGVMRTPLSKSSSLPSEADISTLLQKKDIAGIKAAIQTMVQAYQQSWAVSERYTNLACNGIIAFQDKMMANHNAILASNQASKIHDLSLTLIDRARSAKLKDTNGKPLFPYGTDPFTQKNWVALRYK